MTDQRLHDMELADRVATRLATALDLSAVEADEAHTLLLAGKKQGQAWFDLVGEIIDRHEGETHDSH